MTFTHNLPQGFTVFQTQLGAPLQFIPALGTQELDDMVSMYVPGSAPLSDKRATISVDFLEYAQVTGQAFKFYVVPGYVATSPAESPTTASLSASSINASPVTSNWDWSSVTGGPSRPAVASRKASSSASSRRPAATTSDFSHLPGMKILTKDGLDVTNDAARGSKTKEQRDHAHLMRVIKACDSCRRKKVRCDPSHKKRAATTASPSQQPVVSGRVAKKARISQEKTVAPAATTTPSTTPSSDMLAASSFDTELDWDAFLNIPEADGTLDMTATGDEFWNDLSIPHPGGEEGYNFFHNPQDVLSQSVFGQDAFATSTTSSLSALGDSLSSILSTSSSDQSPSLDVVEQWWSPASIEGDLGSNGELQLATSPGLADEETFTAPAPMAGSLVSLNVWSPDPGCAPLSSPLPAPLPAPSQTILGDSSGRSGGLLYYAAMAMMSATSSSSSSNRKQLRSHGRVAHGALSGSLKTSLAAVVPIVAMSFVAATSWLT
ncbi:uncharacterized protein F5Z01DRAFT_111142 [Emericellopsis atlantica]|uniref:Zn(2)-C6 fungal-type domain-containing protein n=1 Tax=Emericellopsis atlantica TaxID=2614577 RepID=A0A9P7ZKW2_9HYPO|nr:uncharacterized protein F5Z01DRAFT_111142 [Emericellopsis atlantica]KAG9254003.1 hypothetical protein F5Z01DRAFT_111142 [Emericellopsis atlantica]